jgi:hypothetical protein
MGPLSASASECHPKATAALIGTPEISTDGYLPYKSAIRDAFGNRVAHGTITKTYSVIHTSLRLPRCRYKVSFRRSTAGTL